MVPPATTKRGASGAVEAEGLVKRYGAVTALGGLDLAVAEASVFGLLGPNGAGKTTAVSILTTQARADAGRARVAGRDVATERPAVRRSLGLVFQEPILDRELTPREHLDLQARLHHLEDRPRRVAAALAEAGLVEAADRPARALSGGLRRRVEIALGLLHRPAVLFLDEPTVGLDVAARKAIWERVRVLPAEGTTVFLTTHSMEEADTLCGRLAILDRGRVVAEGSPETLKAALGGDVVRFELRRGEGAEAALRALPDVRVVRAEPAPRGGVRIGVTTADGPRRLPALLDAVRAFEVEAVHLDRPTLEHVFLHHTGHAFEPRAEGEGAGSAPVP